MVPDSQLLLRRSREKYRQCLQISVLKATTQYRQWEVQIIVATSVYSALLVGMWKTCFQIQSRAFVLVCTTFFTLNSVRFVLCGVHCAVCNVRYHSRSVQRKSVKLLPGITTVKQYVCEVVLLKPEQRLGRDHQFPVTQTARGRRLSFCPLAEARDCPHTFHTLFEIPNPNLSN